MSGQIHWMRNIWPGALYEECLARYTGMGILARYIGMRNVCPGTLG
jgi:hypothetical protein